MTSEPTTPAVVAEGLTSEEREALLHGKCGVPADKEEWTADCICSVQCIVKLCEIGLASHRIRFPGGVVLTPLGLAIRAHLQESSSGR